jgi:dTMP kinase
MDRYSLSTMAYQIAGRELPLAPCLEALDLATSGLVPDITILLMASYDVGMDRVGGRDKGRDRIEAAGKQFHLRVISGYRAFAKILPQWNVHTIETDGLTLDSAYERVMEVFRAEHNVYS